MASLGLLGGLSAGLEYFAKSREKDDDREKDYELAKRKAELANKLEMDLLKQKQEYAKANPSYSHFVTTPTGNVIAFDTQGNASKAYEGTPEDRNMLQLKLEGDLAYKKAMAEGAKASADSRALIAPTTAAVNDARAIYLKNNPKTGRKPSNEVNEGELQKAVDEQMKRDGYIQDATTVTANDAMIAKNVLADPASSPAKKKGAQATLSEYDNRRAARAKIEGDLRSKYKVVNNGGLVAPAQEEAPEDDGSGGPPDLGVFGNLVPSNDDPSNY